MSTASRVAAAVAAGYVLGRFHKLKFALVVGSALANKKLRSSGLELLQQGSDKMSPEVGKLGEQITGKLVEAGKAAAVAAASNRMDALSDRLSDRSQALRVVGPDEDVDAEEEPEDEYAEEEPEDEYAEDEYAEEEPEDEYAEEEPEDEYAEEEPEEEEPEEEEPEERPRRSRSRSAAGSGRR